MAHVMRWRYGDTNPVVLPVDSETVIEVGDLVHQSGGSAFPASSIKCDSLEGMASRFCDSFLGVAMQASPSGVSDPIRIATSGVFEFECLPTTAEVGDLLGVDVVDGGGQLQSQTVAKVPYASVAVGRCCKRANPAATRLLVEVVSKVMLGGKPVTA